MHTTWPQHCVQSDRFSAYSISPPKSRYILFTASMQNKAEIFLLFLSIKLWFCRFPSRIIGICRFCHCDLVYTYVCHGGQRHSLSLWVCPLEPWVELGYWKAWKDSYYWERWSFLEKIWKTIAEIETTLAAGTSSRFKADEHFSNLLWILEF